MHVATRKQSVAATSRGRAWRRLAAAAVLTLAAAAAADAASKESWSVVRGTSVSQGPVQVSVKVEGRTTPLYRRWDRPDRWYLEAREGARYEVRVRNLTRERVGFVLAVDGLNAVNGRRSRLSPDEAMYVLDPRESATIKGWRRSLRDVSRFVFVDEERSYAERTGQANGDLGWIRLVAFHEREPGVWYDERGKVRRDSEGRAPEAAPERSRGGASAPQARGDVYGAPSDEGNPGTGWGERERDRVRQVDFLPERHAAAHIILRYEYRSGLMALGILPWRGRDRLQEREDGEHFGFAQPPRR